MFLVDSHCHLDQLDLSVYNGDLSKALQAAQDQGVGYFLCVCITLEDYPAMRTLIEPYDNISASVGLHPNEKISVEPTLETLIQLGQDNKVIAIGETGLDYYRSEGDLDWQRERFRRHIRAAIALNKPIIVHSRQAREDTLSILKEENAQSVGGVLHCFTEDLAMANAAIDLNFYVSFSGIVTFNNAKEIQHVAKSLPLEKILIETDSPYLAPIPFRGKTNQPAYVRYVAEYLANLRGISLNVLATTTTANFFKCFKDARHV